MTFEIKSKREIEEACEWHCLNECVIMDTHSYIVSYTRANILKNTAYIFIQLFLFSSSIFAWSTLFFLFIRLSIFFYTHLSVWLEFIHNHFEMLYLFSRTRKTTRAVFIAVGCWCSSSFPKLKDTKPEKKKQNRKKMCVCMQCTRFLSILLACDFRLFKFWSVSSFFYTNDIHTSTRCNDDKNKMKNICKLFQILVD